MKANIEVTSTRRILMKERVPPQIIHPVRIGDPLRGILRVQPAEVEVHRVIDSIVKRQGHDAAALVYLDVGLVVGTGTRFVDQSKFVQKFRSMSAPSAWRATTCKSLDGFAGANEVCPL